MINLEAVLGGQVIAMTVKLFSYNGLWEYLIGSNSHLASDLSVFTNKYLLLKQGVMECFSKQIRTKVTSCRHLFLQKR